MKKILATKLLFDNLSIRQTIVKNTFWLGVGTVTNRLLSLALLIFAARVLGAEGYGQFTFALAFASLLIVFSDFGLSAIVTREFAREPEKWKEFYSLLSLKMVLAIVTFLLIAVTSFVIAPAQNIQIIILTLAVFLLSNSFIGIFHAFFHAKEKMEYEAGIEILQTLLIVVFGIFVLFRFPSPESLGYAYLGAALIALVSVFLFFHFKIAPLRIKWNILVWKKFLKMSWPLAFIGLFGAVYSYTDSVMLGYWNMLKEVGWYNAAYRIVVASLIPMGLIGVSFYPALSRFAKESRERFQRIWDYELEIMIALALPLVVGGMTLASKIIDSLYPADFTPSILAFQILIGVASLIFLYRPFYDALIVLNQQRKTFWITMAGAILNIVLNLILIPKYSLYGAASATIITYSLVLLAIVFAVKKSTFVQLPVLRIFLTFIGSGFAALLMYIVLKRLMPYNIHIFFLVLAGAVTYLLGFLILRKYLLIKYFRQVYA